MLGIKSSGLYRQDRGCQEGRDSTSHTPNTGSSTKQIQPRQEFWETPRRSKTPQTVPVLSERNVPEFCTTIGFTRTFLFISRATAPSWSSVVVEGAVPDKVDTAFEGRSQIDTWHKTGMD